jgi:tol-pal system protein YbgF
MMNRLKRLVLLGMACLMAASAQSQKDMTLQLQRDVTLLQEQLRAMQRTQDEKFGSIVESLRNTLDQVSRANQTVAVIQSSMGEKLAEINKQVSGPMTAVGSKVDSMADQFQSLSNSIADLNSRIGKLDARIVELQKMVQAVQTPVVVPPASTPPAAASGSSANSSGASTAAAAPATGNPAAVPPAQKIYDDAQRDLSAGSYDLALQGFQEFVRNYGTTQMAADAQFYIGEIYSRREDFETAIKEYDKVISDYSDSSRVANARFMKGVACMKLGRRTLAKKEFQTVVDKYPGNELANRSKEYLRALGVTTTQAPTPVTKKATVRRR